MTDPSAPIDLEADADVAALVTVIALVSLACVVEVVGHELIGYSRTLRAVERNLHRPSGDGEPASG